MTSGEPQPEEWAEPSLAEFASELSAAADDVARTLATAPGEAMRGDMGRTDGGALNLHMIMKIPVTMKVVVGSVTLPVADLKKLRKGEVVALDRKVGEPVDIVVNGQILARGMLVIVDPDNARLGVTLTELIDMPDAARSAGAARKP